MGRTFATTGWRDNSAGGMVDSHAHDDGDETSPEAESAPPNAGSPADGAGGGSEETRHPLQVVRGATVVVAFGVVVAFLYFARVILVPVVLATFLSYVLSPVVDQLSRLRLPATSLEMPRVLSVSIVVILTAVLTGALGFVLGNQIRQIGAELPKYGERIAEDIGQIRNRVLELERRVQTTFEPIQVQPESETSETPPEESTAPGFDPPFQSTADKETAQTREIVVREGRNLWQRISPFLAGGLTGLVGYLVQGITLMFVLFFILLQAPNFKQKLLKIVGTTDRRREATLHALEAIHSDVQRYLFGKFLINLGLAVVITLAFFIYGVRYALLLGIIGGLLNFIPYFGAVVGMGIAAVVAYMQFGTASATLTTAIIYFVLTSLEGNIITPIALGRQLQLNSLAVLLGLVFWGWLWGAIGMLLAIPILAASRVVAEHIPDLEPVAEMLRE